MENSLEHDKNTGNSPEYRVPVNITVPIFTRTGFPRKGRRERTGDTLDEKCSECGQGVLESRILISKTGYLGRFYAKKWPRCTASRSCRTIWCIFGATFWTISLCCQRTLTLTASNCANRVQSQIYLDSAEVQTIECNLLQMRHLYLEHAS